MSLSSGVPYAVLLEESDPRIIATIVDLVEKGGT